MVMFSYDTVFCAEIKTDEKTKKSYISISGKLMNDRVNDNFWRVMNEDLGMLAEQFKDTPIKMQHSHSDWEIVGIGVSASFDEETNSISYIAKITDSRAVDKFTTGTWTAKNMGISPAVTSSNFVCSVCNENVRECEHVVGEKYENEIAHVIVKQPQMVESSLTSTPAYKSVGSGNVNSVSMEALVASINEKKAEGLKMSEENTPVTPKVEVKTETPVETKVETPVEPTVKEEPKTTEEPVVDKTKDLEAEIKKLNDELVATKKELGTYKSEVRKAELSKILKDEVLVSEILEQKMTDEEFKAEVTKISKIQKLYATKEVKTEVVASTGSAPIENSTIEDKDLITECFGASLEDITKKLF